MFSFNYLVEHPSEDLIWNNNNLFFVVNKVHRHTLLSQEVKEHWTWKLSPKTILQMCGREFPVLLHHCVAWNLLYGKEADSASGCENYTEDCKQQPPHHQINLYQHMSEMFPV